MLWRTNPSWVVPRLFYSPVPSTLRLCMVTIMSEYNDYYFSQELTKASMPSPIGLRASGNNTARMRSDDSHIQPQSYESRNDDMRYETPKRSTLVQQPDGLKAEKLSTSSGGKLTYNKAQTRYSEVKENMERYKSQCSQWQATYDTLITQYKELSMENNNLQTKYDNQKQLLDLLGQEMKTIQKEVSNVLVETWSSKTDDQLEKDIDRLRKSIESWSRGLEVGTIRELQDKDRSALEEKMCEIMPTLAGEELLKLLERLAKAGVRKMIVTAILSHELSFQIIGDPFFFLERKVGADDQGDSTNETCISPKTIDAMTRFKGTASNFTHLE